MKIKLRDGVGPITNNNFSIYPGQILNVEDGTAFDSEVIEIVKVNKETGFEVFDTDKDIKAVPVKEEQDEVVILSGDFKEIEKEDLEPEIVEEKEELEKFYFTIKYLSNIKGIGITTARKIKRLVKTNLEAINNEEMLRKELNDTYVDLLMLKLKGE